MNVKYTDKVTQWDEGFNLIQQGTRRLEEVLGPAAPLVSAEWDRIKDENGRELIALRLKQDSVGEVIGKFDLKDLRSKAMTAFHLNSLWGNLIQMRIQNLFDDLTGGEH